MKEEYYTNDSIKKEAKAFLDEVGFLRDRHQFSLDPKEAALLVIDCQNFFFDSSSHAFIPSAQAIIPKIIALQDCCLGLNIKVIKTQHVDDGDKSSMMHKWWGGNLPLKGSDSADLISELKSPKEAVIAKSQYDAFYNTDLDAILKSNGIKQLIITGVMTHLCCETTARVAFVRGYEVFLCVDGTATYNRDLHLGALRNSAHGFAIPMLAEEIIGDLKKDE